MKNHSTPKIRITPRFAGAPKKKITDMDFLVTVESPEKIEAKSLRAALNLAMVIDVSPSMLERAQKAEIISIPGYWAQRRIANSGILPGWFIPHAAHLQQNGWDFFGNGEPRIEGDRFKAPEAQAAEGHEWYWVPERTAYSQVPTRMERVKAASIAAVNALTPADRIAVVAFSGSAKVVFESSVATEENKARCVAVIRGLSANGNGTALHDGWKMGARVVCDHIQPSVISRVLLLTDGVINVGIKDPETICDNVAGLVSHGVTTSTFGVGDHFAEDLLLSMAQSGDGRYYFLDPKSMESQFADEFSGLSQLFGSSVKISFDVGSQVTLDECLNGIESKDGAYSLSNIVRGHNQRLIMRGKVSGAPRDGWTFVANLTWTNVDGTEGSVKSTFSLPAITATAYAALSENVEVGERVGELEIAQAKRNAVKALDMGDRESSRAFLNGAIASAAGSMYSGVRGELDGLTSLTTMADAGDMNMLRKTALFGSYETANNRKL